MTVVRYLQSEKLEDFIVDTIINNIELYKSIDTQQKINSFSGTLYNYFVNECVMSNQYLALSKNDYSKIFSIYIDLVNNLRNESSRRPEKEKIRSIVKTHRSRLISILSVRADSTDVIVPCAEYTNGFQDKILRIDVDNLMQPILDVGCGQKASLVVGLRKKGLRAYGIDQYMSKAPYLLCENWLEFNFSSTDWGTIISHMAFSNHFRRCITYNDDEIGRYEDTYFAILQSLKPGGAFIYCPGLPEMENKIDKDRYKVIHYKNNDDVLMDTVYVMEEGNGPGVDGHK